MFRKAIVALVMIVMTNGCAPVRKDNFSVAWKHFNSAFYDNGRIVDTCLLYTSPSPRDRTRSRMPSSA